MSAERRRKCAPRCQCADAFDWLVANGHSLAGLTGQDSPTLRAIAHCWVLYARSCEPSALVAVRALLQCMQAKERHLARELIAWAMDWSDRDTLWPRVIGSVATAVGLAAVAGDQGADSDDGKGGQS